MDLKDLQDHLDKVVRDQNQRAVPDFEGYSPVEMHQILHFPFGAESPITLQKLPDTDYDRIPMLNQIKYLLNLIEIEEREKFPDNVKFITKTDLYDKLISCRPHQGS